MKRTTKLKALVLSVAMAFGMLLPNAAFAQSDDFFRTEDNFGGNRDFATTGAITNNGIGQSEAPLGSGLLILTAVGAGYAVARRKSYKTHRTSKTHRFYNSGAKLVLALALLIGMTNCRKNVETISSVPSNGVHITLNVDGGEKVAVNPTGGGTYATVTWEDGDILYVGNNGAYCGYLTYDKSTSKFGGTITPTSANDGDYLHFYFMGNKGPVGSAPSSVYITDQTSKYPVISYGRSTSLYNSGTSSYSATLYNKCAIGKFTISGVDTDKAITITGMNNTVAVDFSKNGKGVVVNPYTYSKTGSGEIRLHAESNTVRWAILLPQDEVTTATAYASGYTSTGAFTVPAVSANGYYDSGVAVAMASGSPVGAFTINASGDQVFFAPGNLQAVFAKANTSSCTWQFAPNQYSIIGNATANTAVGNNVVTTPGTVDLFGWVGNSGSLAAYGINNNDDTLSYGNTVNEALKSDWDVVANDANLGGHNDWRTLTKDQWVYVFQTRTDASNKYGHGSVNGVHGMIILPDVWVLPSGLSFKSGNSKWANSYTITQWALMEENGAVFLPTVGRRKGTLVDNVDSYGRYWSSTSHESYASKAYIMGFVSNDLNPQYNVKRSIGFSVRLARVVE